MPIVVLSLKNRFATGSTSDGATRAETTKPGRPFFICTGVTVTSPSETARGEFAVYDLEEGLITMVGNVRLERGGSFLSGGRLVIDLDTGRAVMDGGLRGVNQPGGGRVTGRFTVPRRTSRQ